MMAGEETVSPSRDYDAELKWNVWNVEEYSRCTVPLVVER